MARPWPSSASVSTSILQNYTSVLPEYLCASHLPISAPESCCRISRSSSVLISRTIHLVSWQKGRGSTFRSPLIPSCTTGKTTSTSAAHWGITVPRSTLCTSRTLDPIRWPVHSYVSLECIIAILYSCMAFLLYLQDKNVLPIYAEIIGGQPTIAKSTSGVIVAPRSRPPSGGIIAAPRSRPPSGAPLGAITKATSSSGSGSILLEGRYMIKETGVFSGWLWKDRWVSLTSQALVIHRRAFKVRSHLYLSPSCLTLTRCPPSILYFNIHSST